MKTLLSIALSGITVVCGWAQTDWPTFGHDLAGTRYSPLKQITPANVAKLERIWEYHMAAANANADNTPPEGNEAPTDGGRGRGRGRGPSRTAEVSPLVIKGDEMNVLSSGAR